MALLEGVASNESDHEERDHCMYHVPGTWKITP